MDPTHAKNFLPSPSDAPHHNTPENSLILNPAESAAPVPQATPEIGKNDPVSPLSEDRRTTSAETDQSPSTQHRQPSAGNGIQDIPLPTTSLDYNKVSGTVVCKDGSTVDRYSRTVTLADGRVIDFRTAQRIAWLRGSLRWKLDSLQQGVYDLVKKSDRRRWVLKWGRRTGKSFLLCVLAIEHALQHPNSQIKYAAASGKAVRKIIRPLFRKILGDCPKDLQPEFNAQEGEYRFKNGATITVAGCDDGNADGLRGTESHLNIIDEAGFVADLKYVLNDILRPMTLTTDGMTILSSTPPRSLAHPFVKIAQQAEKNGSCSKKTIYDNARLTNAQRDKFIAEDAEEAGLSIEEYKASTTFQREYMAEDVADSDYAVIPEWNSVLAAKVVREETRPPYFDTYVGIDFGYARDAHGVVFGYWDFRKGQLVIENNLRLVKQPSDVLVANIREIEKQLWSKPEDQDPYEPYARIADSGGQGQLIIADMIRTHGLICRGTEKDNKEAAVNAIRLLLRSNQLVIHPRCVELIQQLNTTIWNEARSSYERNQLGHGDLLDALVYLVRNLNRQRNPYPEDAPLDWEGHAHPQRRRRNNEDSDGAVIFDLFIRQAAG